LWLPPAQATKVTAVLLKKSEAPAAKPLKSLAVTDKKPLRKIPAKASASIVRELTATEVRHRKKQAQIEKATKEAAAIEDWYWKTERARARHATDAAVQCRAAGAGRASTMRERADTWLRAPRLDRAHQRWGHWPGC